MSDALLDLNNIKPFDVAEPHARPIVAIQANEPASTSPSTSSSSSKPKVKAETDSTTTAKRSNSSRVICIDDDDDDDLVSLNGFFA